LPTAATLVPEISFPSFGSILAPLLCFSPGAPPSQ
jgi:hypothetical protein